LIFLSIMAVAGAVVVIVSVALVTLVLTAVQAASAGSPLQETAKLVPEKLENVKAAVPLPPGAEIVMVVGFAATAGWGCGAMLTEKFVFAVDGELSESVTCTAKL
jgi:hypothetical protein